MATANLDSLPEECLAQVISFTSPRDACRSALVSAIFRDAADSDVAWEKFLPSDYEEIVARAVTPLEFSSKKDLHRKLASAPLLIDGGNKVLTLYMSFGINAIFKAENILILIKISSRFSFSKI